MGALETKSAPSSPAHELATVSGYVVNCFRESRPLVQLMFFLRFVAGCAVAGGTMPELTGRLVMEVLSWALAAFAVYCVNGVWDVAEDRVNNSTRPIASGVLPVPVASGFVWTAAAGSLALAIAAANLVQLVLAAVFLAIGYAYSAEPFRLKRTVFGASGAVLVLGLLTYAAGWSAVPHGGSVVPVAILGVAMSLWMCMVGAVTKDFGDVRGDMAAGHSNAVASWGDGAARWVGGCNAVVVGLGFVAAASCVPILLPAALVVLAGAVLVAVRCARMHCGAVGSRQPYRAFMLTQHLAHIAVLVTVLVPGLAAMV